MVFLRKRHPEQYEHNILHRLAGKPEAFNQYNDVKAQAAMITYDKGREIPRSSFVVEDQIGSGNFGSVHKGRINDWRADNSKLEVAMKSISGHVGDDDIANFLDEIKIMSYVKPHINLVSLIGACTSELNISREMWLVIEFCKNGELRKYLIKNKNKILSGKNTEAINDRCLVSLSRYLFHGNSARLKLTIHEKFTLLRNHRRNYLHHLLLCQPTTK